MTQLRTIIGLLSLSLALAMPGAGMAEAKSSSSGKSSSSSFKGGFSSQRSSSSGSSAAKSSSTSSDGSASKNTSFGSFGKRSDSASSGGSGNSDQKSGSAMNKDLDRNAANANALKTMDARNAANASNAANANNNRGYDNAGNSGRGNDTQFGRSANGGQYSPPVAPPIAQQPIIINNNSGGSSNGWMWFLLGQSMHSRAPAPSNNTSHNGGLEPIDNRNANAGSDGSDVIAYDKSGVNAGAGAARLPASVKQDEPSGFMHMLRILFWIAVLGGLGWGLYRFLNRGKSMKKSPNYSLGKV
ncbi:hypothetical protein [Undibacterium sp.]|uniref:hypothetical protein n=1 Tax=Undibacterium sp. TaxID=1914977 RepID=UPI0025E84544|nr:hypothetical protein [Undibacterium sp.]